MDGITGLAAVVMVFAFPVAIVGLACRFPGAASPEEFWALLRDGTDPIRAAPEGRWDLGEVTAAALRRDRPVPGSLGGLSGSNNGK